MNLNLTEIINQINLLQNSSDEEKLKFKTILNSWNKQKLTPNEFYVLIKEIAFVDFEATSQVIKIIKENSN